MRPLSASEKRQVVESHPLAAPGEIETDLGEYERLVAAQFQRDPDRQPRLEGLLPAPDPAQLRLAQLHAKLFGG